MPSTWGGRRANQALAHVRALGERHATSCIICGGAIDYRLRYPDPMSCSVQHILSRHHRPDLTWDPTNWAPAHLGCNREAGDGTSNPYDLGLTSSRGGS